MSDAAKPMPLWAAATVTRDDRNNLRLRVDWCNAPTEEAARGHLQMELQDRHPDQMIGRTVCIRIPEAAMRKALGLPAEGETWQ